jgi:hypothetical protein
MTVETKLPRNDHWKVLYELAFFNANRKSKMAATAGHRLTLDPMGKYSNAFFSETTKRWQPSWISDWHKKKQHRRGPSNDHSWAVWFQLSKWFQRKRGKCSNAFFSETTNVIKAKLFMNVHWMVLYKLYVFCSDMKFKMAATAGLSLTLIGTKNVKFVEDHTMNIHEQFGFNHICSF